MCKTFQKSFLSWVIEECGARKLACGKRRKDSKLWNDEVKHIVSGKTTGDGCTQYVKKRLRGIVRKRKRKVHEVRKRANESDEREKKIL